MTQSDMHALESMGGFRAMARSQTPVSRRRGRVWPAVTLFVILGVLFGSIGVLLLATLKTPSPTMTAREQFLIGGLILLFAALFVGLAASLIWTNRRRHRRLHRAARMGIAQGWHVRLEGDPREHAASAFRSGTKSGSWFESPMHLHEPRYVEVGNYIFDAGQAGRGRASVGWIGIELDRALPHMYLFSQADPRRVRPYRVPIFAKDQRLELEGDFNRHFRLLCPREYETDALYVMTPDVMALMIDEASGFDIEIVDDMMFVIARTPFDMTDPRVLEFARRLVATLGSRTASQSVRYVDERSGDPDFIDTGGVRLTRRRLLVTFIPVVAAVIAVAVVGWFSGILG